MTPEVLDTPEFAPELTPEQTETTRENIPEGVPEARSEIVAEQDPEQPRKSRRETEQIALKKIPEEARGALPFPAPPRSNNRDQTIPDDKFFAYWFGLPSHCKDRQIAYIQRQWPVLDYSLRMTPQQSAEFEKQFPRATRKPKDIDAFLRKVGIFKYIDKFTTAWDCRKDWRSWILQHYGEGDYLVFLNDEGVPKNPNIPKQTVCTTITRLRDERFPPVLDWRILNMTDPSNASYVEERRRRGLPLPGDAEEQEVQKQIEEDEMSAVVEQVLQQNKEMTAKVVEMAQQSRKEDTKPQSVAPDIAVMVKATDSAVTMLADTAKRAMEASSAVNNPKEYLKDVLAAADKITGNKPDTSGETTRVLETMMKMQAEQHRQLMEMSEKAHAREIASLEGRFALLEKMIPQPGAPAAPATPGGVGSLIDMVKQVQGLGKLFGAGAVDEADDVPGWVATGERVVEMLANSTNRFMENLVALKQTQANGQQPAPQQANAQTQKPPEEDPRMKQDMIIADQIRDHLIQALQDHYKGYEFAGNIIASFGGPTYNHFVAEGESGLTNFLMRTGLHQMLVTRFGGQAVGQFISEFLDRKKAEETAVQMRAQQQGQAPTGGPRVNRPAS